MTAIDKTEALAEDGATRGQDSTDVAGEVRSQKWRDFPTYLARSLKHQSLLIGLFFCYFLYEHFAIQFHNLDSFDRLSPAAYYVSKIAVGFVCLFVSCYFLFAILRDRPEKLTQYCWHNLKRDVLIPERLAIALPILLLLPPFFSAFSSLKSMIPLIHPFSWDPQLAEWDRLLHFGRHPYEWLHPLLGHPLVTRSIYYLYMVWILVLQGFMMWQAFSLSNTRLRMRFLLTYVLSWVLIGTTGGTLLSSAGPVYFAQVTGEIGPYQPLLAYLDLLDQDGGFGLVEVQRWLWDAYLDGVPKAFAGISAMPSMHVGLTVLFYLVARSVNRWLGYGFLLYTLVILVGSVHLAWHYAIDGYASGLAVIVIWLLVGALQKRLSFLVGLDRVRPAQP